MKQGVLFFLLFFSLGTMAQSDLSLKLEVAPWQLRHDFAQISHPFSLGYTVGLNFEKVIAKSNFAILTGLEYDYAPKGNKYVDLTDKQNLLAVIYEQEFNQRFIGLPHHQLAVPIMLICYFNDLRVGAGISFNRYYFGQLETANINQLIRDYGVKAQFGSRMSKHVTFSISYYYGLNSFATLSAFPDSSDEASSISGNMQQFSVGLKFSIFNNLKDQKYYLSGLNP